MSKVAVASTDGVSVNEHFGRAQEFYIYEVEADGAYRLLERRDVSAAAQQGVTTASLLEDVQAVLVAQLGKGADKELRKRGIVALSVNQTIDEALAAYGQKGIRMQDECPPPGQCGCTCSHGEQ